MHQRVSYDCWHGAYILEVIRTGVKKLFHFFDPFLYACLHRTDRIYLGQNTTHYPYTCFKDKICFLPQAGSVFPVVNHKPRTNTFNILFVGRLVNLKGVTLVDDAFYAFLQLLDTQQKRKVTCTIIGEGPLSHDINQDNLQLLPWQPQNDLAKYYLQSSVFFYPSFEGQGLVVAEALAHGTPVICLMGTGPHDVAGNAAITIPQQAKDDMVTKLSLTLYRLFMEYFQCPEKYQSRVDSARQRARQLDWQLKAETILKHYHE